METLITQLGIGGVFALLLIREVTTFYSKINGKDKKNTEIPQECHESLGSILSKVSGMKELAIKTQDLSQKAWDMHNVRDDTGVPVWYVSALKASFKRLSDIIEKQSEETRKLTEAIRNNRKNGG